MIFRRITDLDFVRRIMTDPSVYPWITDEGSPAPEDFRPADHPSIWYVLVESHGELLGMWMLVPQNSICWEIHTCLLPAGRGEIGAEAAQEFQRWIWANTPCRRLVTNVPAFNRAALKFAKEAGMEEFGRNAQSFAWRGRVWDQVMLGLTRPAEAQREVA